MFLSRPSLLYSQTRRTYFFGGWEILKNVLCLFYGFMSRHFLDVILHKYYISHTPMLSGLLDWVLLFLNVTVHITC